MQITELCDGAACMSGAECWEINVCWCLCCFRAALFFFILFIWSLEFCMWLVGRPNKKDFKNIDIYLSIFANELLICSGFVYLVRVCLFEAHFCILLWCMSFNCIFGCKVCTCGAFVLVQHICLFACVASVCSVNVHEVVSLMFLLSFAVISCCVLSPLGLAWFITVSTHLWKNKNENIL